MKKSDLNFDEIKELMQIAPQIFLSKYKVVRNKTGKRNVLKQSTKRQYELFYKKLISTYNQNDSFTVESSYKNIFGDDDHPTLHTWKKFIKVLMNKGIVKHEDMATKTEEESSSGNFFKRFFSALDLRKRFS